MPGFIKTPSDEKKWNAIKHSVAKQRGKSTEDFTDRDWATVNAAWHKSEGNLKKFEEIMKSLTSLPKPVSMRSAIAGASTTSGLKMPKVSGPPKPGATILSEFNKKENFGRIKHPSIENLRVFLEKTRSKKQS